MPRNIPDHLRCSEPNSRGGRCGNQRVRDDTMCARHIALREKGPNPETVKMPQAPTRKHRSVTREAVEVVRSVGVEVADPDHLDPTEVMAHVVNRANWLERSLSETLEDLDLAGLLRDEGKATDLDARLRLYVDILTAVRKSAEAAESAGMQRRRVVLEEAKVRVAFGAIERAIDRMGFDIDTTQRLKQLIGEELAAVSGAAA